MSTPACPWPLTRSRIASCAAGPASKPQLEPPPQTIQAPVLLALGDSISTDEIMPAGSALSLRSNIPALAEHYFRQVDEEADERALRLREDTGHLVIGGDNYGPRPSREHGALVPAFLGLRAVIAKSYARIHAQNLVNFGILPLLFCDPGDQETIDAGTVLRIDHVHDAVRAGGLINHFRHHRT